MTIGRILGYRKDLPKSKSSRRHASRLMTNVVSPTIGGVAVWSNGRTPGPRKAKYGTSRAAKEYIKYCTNFKRWFDERMRFHGLDLILDIGGILKRLGDPELSRSDSYIAAALNMFKLGERRGQVSQEQIWTAVDVFVMGQTDSIINILGPTQGGKSGTMIFLFFLEPLCKSILTGQIYRPVLSLVNQRSLDAQIRIEFQNFVNLHAYLGVRNNGQVLYISEYFSNLGYGFAITHDWANAVIRNSVAKVGEFRKVFSDCHSSGLIPLIYIDEFHQGSNRGGVLDRWAGEPLKAAKEKLLTEEKLLLVAKKEYPDCHFRFITATPYETIDIAGLSCVYHWIGRGYVGFPWFMGRPFPITPGSGYKMKLPDFYSYQEFFHCQDLCRESYRSVKTFLRYQLGISSSKDRNRLEHNPRVIQQWRSYQSGFKETLIKIIKNLLIAKVLGKKHLEDGVEKCCSGICIRVSVKNKAGGADDIADVLDSVLPRDMKLLRQYGEHIKDGRSIEDTVTSEVFNAGFKSYVILVTGGSRMGVYYPASCGYKIDLTRESSNNTSFLQGLVGRAQGYFKNTVVFLSRQGLEDVKEYIRNRGLNSKKPGSRSRYVNSPPGSPNINVDVLRSDVADMLGETPEYQILLDFFDAATLEIGSQIRSGKPFRKADFENSAPFWASLSACFGVIERYPQCIYTSKNTNVFMHVDLLQYDFDASRFPELRRTRCWKAHCRRKGGSKFVTEHPRRGNREERRSVYDGKIGRRWTKPGELREILRRSKSVRSRRTSTPWYADKAHQNRRSVSIIDPRDKPELVVTFQPQIIIEESSSCVVGITLTLRTPAKSVGLNTEPTEKSLAWVLV